MRPSGKEGKSQQSAEVRKNFTDAAIRFPGDFAKQAKQIVRAHRPAGLPEHFQPLNMGLSDWERIRRDRERQKQESDARVRREQQQPEQRRLAQERADQARIEQDKRDEVTKGQETCDQLEQEMRSTPLTQIAENIKQEWQAQSPNVSVTLTPVREPEVEIRSNSSGERAITDKSRVGLKLSYAHQDLEKYEMGSGQYLGEGDYEYVPPFEGVGTVQEELIVGLYFTRFDIIPEANKPEYHNTGVKAYFIETSGLVGPSEHRHHAPAVHTSAIPVEYPNSLQKLYELLADRASDLAPSNVIPEASLRIGFDATVRTAHEEPPVKKGFWRNLFRKD